jgi:hypothetical protein
MARIAPHATCEAHHQLKASTLAHSGLLSGSGTLSWTDDGLVITVSGYDAAVVLKYTVCGKDISERITIDKTPVHLGGHRAWFRCPGCDRRVAALYLLRKFRCRHCHDLRYQSQRETPKDRAITRMKRVRKKLGGTGNLLERRPPRPRYMRRQTYERLVKEEEAAHLIYVFN